MSQFNQKNPRSVCANPVCDKEVSVRSVRGADATGFCSRVCASTRRYAKRYVGMRSNMKQDTPDLTKKMKI